MKSIGLGLVGLLIGFLAGGVRPRADLAVARELTSSLEDELVKVRSRAARCAGSGGGFFPGVAGILGAPIDVSPEEPVVRGAEPRDDTGQVDAAAEEEPTQGAFGQDDEVSEEEAPEEFAALVDAQAFRAAQSRAALIEGAGLSVDETDSLDAVVDEMNDELADSLNNLGMSVMASDELSPADLLALTHEVSGTLLDAQQAVGEIVGDARMDGVPLEARPVWNMFDLGVLNEESLTEALGVAEGRD